MQFLKADTAATVLVGPFLDKTDGVTPETGITLGAADSAEIMKHDGTTFTDISALTFTHKAHGMYTLAITSGHLDTEGRLTVFISDESECLPVWAEFMVVNANVYDSLFAADTTDYLRVDAFQIAGTTQDATDLADFAAAGYDPGTNKVQGVVLADTVTTLTGHTAQTGDSYARLGAPAGASIAADLVTIDNFVDDLETRLSVARAGYLDNLNIGENVAGTSEISGLNNISTAQVNAEVDTALADIKLDHLINIAVDTDFATTVHEDSVIGEIAQRGGANLWDRSTDSLEALRNTDPIGSAMVGTDNAALASVCTEARLAELDGANIPADVDLILADTNELQTDDVPALIAALNDPSAATIADAVWDELATGHTDAGKAGEQLWTDVDAILADTNELQQDDVPGLIAALNDISAADVWDSTEAITGDTLSFETMIARMYSHVNNEMNITDATGYVELRNAADSAEMANCTITDDATTTQRTELTWA